MEHRCNIIIKEFFLVDKPEIIATYVPLGFLAEEKNISILEKSYSILLSSAFPVMLRITEI